MEEEFWTDSQAALVMLIVWYVCGKDRPPTDLWNHIYK